MSSEGSLWMQFLAWEERAAAAGSGMTDDQKTGAALFRSWLVNHAPEAAQPAAGEGRLDFIAQAQHFRAEHDATHGEAEMCGAECIVLGLTEFEPVVEQPEVVCRWCGHRVSLMALAYGTGEECRWCKAFVGMDHFRECPIRLMADALSRPMGSVSNQLVASAAQRGDVGEWSYDAENHWLVFTESAGASVIVAYDVPATWAERMLAMLNPPEPFNAPQFDADLAEMGG